MVSPVCLCLCVCVTGEANELASAWFVFVLFCSVDKLCFLYTLVRSEDDELADDDVMNKLIMVVQTPPARLCKKRDGGMGVTKADDSPEVRYDRHQAKVIDDGLLHLESVSSSPLLLCTSFLICDRLECLRIFLLDVEKDCYLAVYLLLHVELLLLLPLFLSL